MIPDVTNDRFRIDPGSDHDPAVLLEIWQRAVRATHTFLSEDDVQFYLPIVRDGALKSLELWVLATELGEPVGFLGLSDDKIEMLFLAPEVHRSGGGRQLVAHAERLREELTVDVNEQNPGAVAFYEACGFVVEGRSALDGSGRPFPLLHMRKPAATR